MSDKQETRTEYNSEDRMERNEPKRKMKNKRQTHPFGWCKKNHYGMCGQSCPCCRKKNKDILGSCTICK